MISYDMSFNEYAAAEGANASKLKTLYDDEPARLQAPVSDQKKPNAALRMGTIAHMALLEPELMISDERVLPELNLHTKADRGIRDAHSEKYGYDWLYSQEAETIAGMGKALRSNPDSDVYAFCKEIDSKQCKTEVSVFADIPNSSFKAKVRFDAIIPDFRYGLDYKTTVSCRPDQFIKNAINLHYDLAAAFYMDVYEWAAGEKLEVFALLAQEKTEPYLFNLFEFQRDSTFIEKGREKYRKALEMYEKYRAGFKGYDGNAIDGDLLLPSWYR